MSDQDASRGLHLLIPSINYIIWIGYVQKFQYIFMILSKIGISRIAVFMMICLYDPPHHTSKHLMVDSSVIFQNGACSAKQVADRTVVSRGYVVLAA